MCVQQQYGMSGYFFFFFFFFLRWLYYFFFFFLVNMGQLVNSLVLALPKITFVSHPSKVMLKTILNRLKPQALSSFSCHCTLQDGFGQTWWTGDMTIPLQFASLYDGQKVFVWFDCLLDLGTDFPVGNMLFVWDAKCPAVAPRVHGLHFSLELCFWLS